MKKGLVYGAILMFGAAAMWSCKDCKTCDVQTITVTTTDTSIVIDTVMTAEEYCGLLLENIKKDPAKVDSSADGSVHTYREYTCN